MRGRQGRGIEMEERRRGEWEKSDTLDDKILSLGCRYHAWGLRGSNECSLA